MDYTEIFSKAVKLKLQYSFDDIQKYINKHYDFHCGDWDAWEDNNWYLLTPTSEIGYDKCYGYLCAEYPVALLSDNCPEGLKCVLSKIGVLYAKLEEPMSCDENVLRQYVHGIKVFDESFVDSCEYEFDDERYLMVLNRLETGCKQYIDSECFTMREIR